MNQFKMIMGSENIDIIYKNENNFTKNISVGCISNVSQSSVNYFPFKFTEDEYLEKIEFIKSSLPGICSFEENAKEDKENEEREFNSNFASLQSWYIRISHTEKLNFVLKLLEVFSVVLKRSTNLLIDILGPVPKDFIYAKTQFTFSKYDMTPLDSNRCLTDIPLAEAKANSLSWFSELEEKEQVRVMIILLNLSGSVITFQFYFKAVKFLEKKNVFDPSVIEAKLMNYKFYNKMMAENENSASGDIGSVTSRKSYLDSYMQILSNNVISETRNSDAFKKVGSVISSASTVQGATSWDYTRKLKEWEKEFNGVIQASGLLEPGSMDEIQIPIIDMLQLLPISVNRYIHTFLDRRSKKHLRMINKYWNKSASVIHKEEHTREWLNHTIKTLSYRLFRYRTKDLYSEVKYVNPKIHESSSSDQEIRRSSMHSTTDISLDEPKRSLSSPSLFSEENLFKPKYTLQMVPAPTHEYPNKYPKNPYRTKFIISEVFTGFDHTRCIAANFQWIAISNKFNITLLSLLSGAPSPHQLADHTGYVTVLRFHPSKTCLFSGSCDTTIKYWDIYSGKVIATYTNNKSVINDIDVDEKHVVSVSMDQTLRVFNIESGSMLWRYIFSCSPLAVALGRKLDIYVGFEDGSIFKTDLKSTPTPNEAEITSAHGYGVSCILFDEPFVVTGADDGFVRVWHFEHFDASAIATFDHNGMPISAVALSFMKVLTTTIDGILRIWNIYNSKLKREIVVNIAKTPILSMICLEIYDHSKVIINSEDTVKVVEFPFYWINFTRACLVKDNKEPKIIRGLKRITTTKPANVLSPESQLRMMPKHRFEKQCRERLLLRHAAFPAVVNPSIGDTVTLKEVPIFSKALLDYDLLSFPRIIPESPKMKQNVIKSDILDSGPKVLSGLWKYLPRSSKGVLPIFNPSKRSI